MRKLLGLLILLTYSGISWSGAYKDHNEKRRLCEAAAGFGEYAYAFKVRQEKAGNNLWLAEKEFPKAIQEQLDAKTEVGKSVIGRITRDIWFEISLSDRITSKREANRYGWAACMDAAE